MIEARYRRDYSGEFVVTNTDIRLGIKQQHREWIANPVVNQHVSGRAAVIGSGIDQKHFDYTRLERHRGGLQGRLRLQTYGTGPISKDMRLDFCCSTDRPILTQLQSIGYNNSTICYSTSRFCLMFPGKFFLIPFQPNINDLAAAAYLAAFDGHQEIFLLGYNQDTPGNSRRWQQDVADVISAYHTHQFFLIGTESNMPDIWRNLPNVECHKYRWFVHHCDI